MPYAFDLYFEICSKTRLFTFSCILQNRLELDYDYDMKMEWVRGSIFTDDGNMQTSSNYSVYNDFKNVRISCIHFIFIM